MRKILTGAAILALSTSLLTGCSGMIEAIEKSANYSDVEKIDYNLYRISGTRPNINQQLQLREFLYQRAQDFCMRNGQGAQLLDGVSGKNPKGEGVKAIVVFRLCRHHERTGKYVHRQFARSRCRSCRSRTHCS